MNELVERTNILIIPLVFFFIFSIPFSVISQSLTSEATILLKLKQEFGNPEALQAWNISSSSSLCNWPGISCSVDGYVSALIFKEMDIIKEIPGTICELKNLTYIDLSYNLIPGNFPTVLYNCSKLVYLDLSQNYFVGTIPLDVNRLNTLRFIDLGANNFTGDVPGVIGNLRELRSLNLYSNLFNGSFPEEIGNLENLVELKMAYNGFLNSKLPQSFGKLSKLEVLWMAETNLVGEIPGNFTNLSSLVQLDLSSNYLEGKIPDGLFLLKNLSNLYLYKNRFSGSIPSVIEAFSLSEIDLSMNNLTGTIPEVIGKLQNLELLNLFKNQLHGEVPAIIGKIPSLKHFKVFKNNLSGILPPELGFHSKFESFEVSDNHFSGELPENMCAGGTLLGVVAFSNNLIGGVPKSLQTCDSLLTVQLYNNNFSGEVPSGLWSVKNLTSLMLSNNSFTGQLPEKIAGNLTRIELSNNKFSGGIPGGVSTWTRLVVFEASNNLFSGNLPVELTNLPQVITLNLDGNSFSGVLPSEISSWKSISKLNLARNKLSGPIPRAIGYLPRLLDLDLSENQLSGEIPPEFNQLRLITLNLSSNQLTGKIPHEFDSMAYENSFLNNPNLCATSSISNLKDCNAKARESKKMSSRILAIIVVLSVVVFLFSICMTLFLVRNYRRKKLKHDLESWKLTSFQRVDFTEVNILSSMSDSNMIGSGGSGKVYKISIGQEGDFVAVKKIRTKGMLDYKSEQEFLAEVQILGSIRHANIVKLLCCIASDDSKLLVYEYMENHSLDKCLHVAKQRLGKMVLDWSKRFEIALGAAQGLCYMHHDCIPPIIHRDVKSSNILLDSEFKAKIADFGLAKILFKENQPNTMSAIAGSFGYIAPEYGYTTKVNVKTDVYSFGVVLLELVTGREANDGDDASLAEWAWKQYGEGKPIEQALDKEITEPAHMEGMTIVFKLGLKCTSALPSSRPSMKEVLQILRNCKRLDGHEGMSRSVSLDIAPLLADDRYFSNYKRGSKKRSDQTDSSLFISSE
ncbi:transmembrane signal receptor [Lithospermum erythrorhizon]|uniref:Transmembrane signal receptor n=1 Tax=Lithospermum erythrorhizon TaxID=34254 RepID=A0AAV3QE91_LITER